MCCFWPVEVSETLFFNFWTISWGAKHGPKGQKNLHLGSRLIFFSGPRYGKEASPIIFLGFFRLFLRPPDHPKCPGFGLWAYRIFLTEAPVSPNFRFSVLGNEYAVLVFEYRKRSGISRVKGSSVRCTHGSNAYALSYGSF